MFFQQSLPHWQSDRWRAFIRFWLRHLYVIAHELPRSWESVFIANTTCEDRRIVVRSVDRHLDLTPFSADGKRVTILVREHVVIVPLWIPTLGFVTALWFSSPLSHDGRHRKRKKLGLCVKCEYDLRGSEEHCPELPKVNRYAFKPLWGISVSQERL